MRQYRKINILILQELGFLFLDHNSNYIKNKVSTIYNSDSRYIILSHVLRHLIKYYIYKCTYDNWLNTCTQLFCYWNFLLFKKNSNNLILIMQDYLSACNDKVKNNLDFCMYNIYMRM